MTAGQSAALALGYAREIRAQVEAYSAWRPHVVRPFIDWHIQSALGRDTRGHAFHKVVAEDFQDLPEAQRLLAADGATVLPAGADMPGVTRHAPPQAAILGLQSMPDDTSANVVFTAQDAASLALWDRHKTVYSIDPELWEALGDTADDTEIPKGLFARLPHPDPFVAFPRPLVLPLDDGQVQHIGGFFLSGRLGGAVQCSTHVRGVDSYGLLAVGPVYLPDGRPHMLADGHQDVMYTRVTVRDGQVMGDLIERAKERFYSITDSLSWQDDMPAMVRRAMSLLVYLCATNADLTPLPVPPVKGKGGKRRKNTDAPGVVAVGFRVGGALRSWKAEQKRADRGEPTGRRMAPHVRRAHFHTYRVGPGRTGRLVKWLAPIEINIEGALPVPTVHDVEGRRHDSASNSAGRRSRV